MAPAESMRYIKKQVSEVLLKKKLLKKKIVPRMRRKAISSLELLRE